MRNAQWASPLLFVLGFAVLAGIADDRIKNAVAIVFIYLGSALIVLGNRIHALRANQTLLSQEKPVLYLRSFKVDERDEGEKKRWKIREIANVRDEEALAELFSPIGPMIAIGQPGEKLPQLGAARVYFAHEHWQAGVREMMDRSVVVILRVAESEGFLWEVQNVVSCLPPAKVILYFSERWHGKELKDQYARFVEKTRHIFLAPLPPQIDREHFLVFDENWTPSLVGPMRRRGFFNRVLGWMLVAPVWNFFRQQALRRRLAKALAPWFASRGVAPLPRRLFGLRAIAFGAMCSGPLAPGVMVAWNLYRIGQRGKAVLTLFAAVATGGATYAVGQSTHWLDWVTADTYTTQAVIAAVVFTMLICLVAKALRPDVIHRHFALAGARVSILLSIPLIVALAIAWLRIFPVNLPTAG